MEVSAWLDGAGMAFRVYFMYFQLFYSLNCYCNFKSGNVLAGWCRSLVLNCKLDL